MASSGMYARPWCTEYSTPCVSDLEHITENEQLSRAFLLRISPTYVWKPYSQTLSAGRVAAHRPKNCSHVKKDIAFIGLGVRGLPMATNLVSAGYPLIGYTRSEQKRRKLAQAGGQVADSVVEVVRNADVVITMLPDSPDVEDVLVGGGDVPANCREGAYWIDSSTIRPDVSAELAAQAREIGLLPLDAPVSGVEQGAVDGALSIMAGGDRSDYELVKAVLEVLGDTVVYVGPSGSGQTVKAANQFIVAGNIDLVC